MAGTGKYTDYALLAAVAGVLGLGGWYAWACASEAKLDKLDIVIDGSDRHGFVTGDNVHGFVQEVCGGDMRYGSVQVSQVEEYLSGRPYIDSAEVYKDMNGTLHLLLWQSRPLLRLVPPGGPGVYVSDRGGVMPLSRQYAADVIPVTCDSLLFSELTDAEKNAKKIPGNYNILDNLVNFVNWVEENAFWRDQITQINVNDRREVELIPRAGSEMIVLCDVADLANFRTGLGKLKTLYRRELRTVGVNKYRIINVKYKDLIVCTK